MNKIITYLAKKIYDQGVMTTQTIELEEDKTLIVNVNVNIRTLEEPEHTIYRIEVESKSETFSIFDILKTFECKTIIEFNDGIFKTSKEYNDELFIKKYQIKLFFYFGFGVFI